MAFVNEEGVSWQQEMEHVIAPVRCGLPACSHSPEGLCDFAGGRVGFPWARQRPSLQQAIPRACHAVAQRGLQSRITARRQTKAASFFPGAIGSWSRLRIGLEC